MLSVVAICKNEKDNIIPFVNSWSAVADEIVICDTGSDDGTMDSLRDLCEESRINLVTYEWDGSFSNARNFVCSQVDGDQILWADLDDRIDVRSIEKIKSLSWCPMTPFRFQVASDVGNGCYQRFMQLRMFPSHMRFVGDIHEKVDVGGSIPLDEPEVIIAHLGYADEETKKKKAVRNLEILLKDGIPKDIDGLLHTGDALYALGKFFVGLGYYEEAARRGGRIVEEQIADKLVAGYIAVGAMHHKIENAIEIMEPGSVKKWYWMAAIYRSYGNAMNTEKQCLEHVLYGERDLSGRLDDSDIMIFHAKKRIAEIEEKCPALA